MAKHLMCGNKHISVKNNKILTGRGTMLKIERHGHIMDIDHPIEYEPREHAGGSLKVHHQNTNLDRLRSSLANISLNTKGKKYVNF